MFKKYLIIAFAGVVIVGGVSAKTLPIFDKAHTTAKQAQSSNRKDITVASKTVDKSVVASDSTSLSDVKDSDDNSQNSEASVDKQETTVTKTEKSTNHNNTYKQPSASSISEKDVNSTGSTENQNKTNTTIEPVIPAIYYDRTTSIYANDNVTLLRVEYYKNNKLTYYSVVEQFDTATKSYIEKIYQCNLETNIDPFIRTDVYVNGNLVKSY